MDGGGLWGRWWAWFVGPGARRGGAGAPGDVAPPAKRRRTEGGGGGGGGRGDGDGGGGNGRAQAGAGAGPSNRGGCRFSEGRGAEEPPGRVDGPGETDYHESDAPFRPPRVLLGVTGSVAAVKAGELVQALEKRGAKVRVVTTAAGARFLDSAQESGYQRLPGDVEIFTDEQEWASCTVGEPVLHIELRKWADVLCVAPLSANSLAKMAGGLCDNLLTCVFRAWELKHTRGDIWDKPVVVAPAMNTLMWRSRFTALHLKTLRKMSVSVVPPVSKRLACGDVGRGAMADPDVIANKVMIDYRTKNLMRGGMETSISFSFDSDPAFNNNTSASLRLSDDFPDPEGSAGPQGQG